MDIEFLSPIDCSYQYHQAAEVTMSIARECNDEVAQMVRDHPDRSSM